ncbi:glutathione S-transferase [Xylaria sp. FL0043]|nr:glutathione S-transferase [Xylaria sp. FL0043]
MSNLQTLIVYSSGPAPNPYKVAFVLEELGLPWKFESLPMLDLKKEPYTNLNPNGRVPTLVDPNTDMTIWEIPNSTTPRPRRRMRHAAGTHHAEKLPSAIERFKNEVKRVIGVIDGHLAKQGTDFLVGDKPTYADLMFIPYFKSVGMGPLTVMAKDVDTAEWVHYTAWMKRLHERPAVAKVAKIYDDASVQVLAAGATDKH